MMKKIILLGDSITEAFPADFFINEFEIVNKGISGDSTEGVYKRLPGDVISLKPDMVFLLIGTNDFAQGLSNGDITAGVFRILLSLKNALDTTIIVSVSILPVRDLENRSNARIIQVNNEIRNITEELNLKYFDLHSSFRDDTGKLRKEFTEDGLHLTADAYRFWGELLRKFVSNIE